MNKEPIDRNKLNYLAKFYEIDDWEKLGFQNNIGFYRDIDTKPTGNDFVHFLE